MATFKAVIFSTPNHIKKDGTTNIKIRIFHNGKAQYIATPYFIQPGLFKPNGKISSSYPDYAYLNHELGEMIQRYSRHFLQIGSFKTSRMQCDVLRDHLIKLTSGESNFIDFVAFSYKIIDETPKLGTVNWYKTSLESFVRFYGRESIDIREVNAKTLNAYIKAMYISGTSGKPMDSGGINNYLRGIRALFNKCKQHYNDEDNNIIPIPHNPFSKIKMPQPRRRKKNLSIEAVKQIRDFKNFNTYRQELGCDMFMLMFYLMGINVNDLYNIWNIQSGRIIYERAKVQTDSNVNNFPLSVKLEKEALEIINKYSKNNIFLSEIKNRFKTSNYFMDSINAGLRDVCEKLTLPRVTTNWARHSWASIARNKAFIPKADIDFCLGHVNNDHKMADVYIEIDYSIYDKTNRKVLDLLLDTQNSYVQTSSFYNYIVS